MKKNLTFYHSRNLINSPYQHCMEHLVFPALVPAPLKKLHQKLNEKGEELEVELGGTLKNS